MFFHDNKSKVLLLFNPAFSALKCCLLLWIESEMSFSTRWCCFQKNTQVFSSPRAGRRAKMSPPHSLSGRARKEKQSQAANCILKNLAYYRTGNKSLIGLLHCTDWKELSQQVYHKMDQPLTTEKQALLQHVMAFRDDWADEFSCKDKLNCWKLLCGCFLFK